MITEGTPPLSATRREDARQISLDFELLFRCAPSLLLVLEPTAGFRILGASDAYLRASRSSREAIVGKPFFEVFPETVEGPRATGAGSLKAALERVLATHKADSLNSPVLDAQGHLRYVIHRADAMEMELLRASDERDDALRRLKSANEELEAFARATADDLRSPMRAIDGFCRLFQQMKGPALDDGVRRLLGRIGAKLGQMESVVEDLQRLVRVGQASLKRERVDVAQLARAAADEWAAREPQRRVRFDIAPGLEAWADRDLVALALDNLIANAWNYTSGRDEGHVEVGARTIVGQTVLYVRDNGVGFDMAKADRLFTPFSRMHEDGRVGSHGIGLACVKRIVQRHGGEIWAEAVPGEGACFHFTLNGVHVTR
ncbi:MAG TPA: ATP-binding protein [Usitatibacter sp.]|jgi:signal transduction histidine kinase|nr:ATP-binding protein [Usitatibacter sp.]